MQRYRFISLATVCCVIVTSHPLASETDLYKFANTVPHAQEKKPVMASPDANDRKVSDIVIPSGLNFSSVSDAGFLETRRALVASIYESETGLSSSQETTEALLRLAQFYLTHAMIVEGQSIVTSLKGAILSKEQTARLAGMSIALNVLDPWGMVASKTDISLLEGPDDWPGHALFRSLYFKKNGELKKAAPYLAEAAKDVLALPEPIKEMVLPELLEAAIDLEDWKAARRFAEFFRQTPHLNEGSAYHYLLGLTAERGHDYLVAFDHFAKATEKLDRWSQLARLSLVKIGLKTKTLPPQDARKMLEQMRYAWRGDALSAETLDLLIATELSLNDIPAALEVLGEIIYMNYDADTVEKAKERSNALLATYYNDGISGKISLTKFLQSHKRITPDYRFQKGFDKFSEKFADKLYAVGASNEAAIEYETTYNYLSVSQDLGLFDVPTERLDQLRLKQAAALLRGGQYDSAEPILALGAESGSSDIQDEFTDLKVKFFNLTGNVQSVLDTKTLKPSIDYLRIKAKAYFSSADWENSAKTYLVLWKQQGNDLLFTDASNLLLSAYRNNDTALALRLAKAFPDLTSIPQWQQIAAGLVRNRDATGVLQKDTIAKDISDASRVLDVLDVINAAPE